MLIHFYIQFASRYGESLHIRFKGQEEDFVEFPLNYIDEESWHDSFQSEALPDEKSLDYSVVCRFNNGEERTLINRRRTDLRKVKRSVIMIKDMPDNEQQLKIFESIPFSEVFYSEKAGTKKDSDKDPDIIFKVKLPPLENGMVVCITGSSKKLKEWNERKPLQLSRKGDTWSIRLNISKEKFPIEYKFCIFDPEAKKIVQFEEGSNRILQSASEKDVISIYHYSPVMNKHYWKGAGVNVPVSAIKTEQTWGIGSFTTVHLLIDWAKKSGLKMIQLLPVNDTSATLTKKDSYPYAPISVFALHPLYLNVQKLATAFGVELSMETMDKIHELNELSYVDYEGVLKLKMDTLRLLYNLKKQSYKDDFAWFEYFDINRHWLVPYAAFCYLREKYGTSDFQQWGEYKIYHEDSIQELASTDNEHYDDIAFYYFIQYHLHLQLKDASEYAHKNGIILKADLPIGVGRHSVDTWMYPHLFKAKMQAGAPPDGFTSEGQNWAFPTYNWEAMAKDDYAWWRKRMEHVSAYFDAVRIDHVLGFFRMWSIPVGIKKAVLGKFDPVISLTRKNFEEAGMMFDERRLCETYDGEETNIILIKEGDGYHFRINMQQTSSYKTLPVYDQEKLDALYHRYYYDMQNALWEKTGRERLAALQNYTGMMLCAEDLGMVPTMVAPVLEEMQILSLQVQRMPRSSSDNFSHPKNARYMNVVTPATHDMSPLREWWREEKAHIQYFYNYLMEQPGDAPYYAEAWICRNIVLQHLKSDSMWVVFLIQDLLATNEDVRRRDPSKERINDPSDADHVWDYRMHITMEDLLHEKDFISEIKTMVKENCR